MSSNTMISLRPQNVIRQIPWKLDSKAALGFLLILATFSLVGWLYLSQASAVTTTSYRIDEMRVELDQLKNQNATLILQIAELEALARVEGRARELGFKPAINMQYVNVANYPNSVEIEDSIYFTTQTEMSINSYTAELEAPSWWIERLDEFAAWLEE